MARRSMAVFAVLMGCLWLVCPAANGAGAHAGVVLVENGESRAPIVVFEGAPPFTRRAAEELAEYIEKTSGARPEIVDGRPDPLPENAIWVGYQPVLDELFPGLDFAFERPEEILIAANRDHVVIAGRDRWNPEHLAVRGRSAVIEGRQDEYGTANAVYTFLQDQLGVRWLWPGEEDVPEKETIALEPFEYRYHPQIRDRDGLFRLSALGDGRGHSHEWVRRQRLQLDSLQTSAGHAFGNWWNDYHEAHPEYFALQPDGTRSAFPAPGTVKICQSNPAVWRQWLANVEQELRERPYATGFSASPNDSAISGHCICPQCLAWDHPGGERVRYTWQGLTQEYVSLTDRQVTFANTLARLLKERFPDRELLVGMHSYGDASVRPPVEAVPDDNVVISLVASFFMHNYDVGNHPKRAELVRDSFKGWAEVAPKIVWRPNMRGGAGWGQGQPDIAVGQTIEDFRFVGEHNCIGLMFDTVWENWPTQGPNYYMMAQMAWNPRADGQAILRDYYQRGFRSAAPEIEAYWRHLEAARDRKLGERIGEGVDWGVAYDEAFFDRARALLAAADEKLAGEPEAYRRRVEFFRRGLEFTRLMVDVRVQMAQYHRSEGADEAVAQRARENWEEIKEIATQNLMNYWFFNPGNRYSRGLHPDYD